MCRKENVDISFDLRHVKYKKNSYKTGFYMTLVLNYYYGYSTTKNPKLKSVLNTETKI